MSSSGDRRTFYGIAPTWIAPGNGKQLPEFIDIITFSTFCDVAFLGDVNPIITFGIGCEIDSENIDVFINMGAACSTTFLGDVNPIVNMTMFCVVMVSNP